MSVNGQSQDVWLTLYVHMAFWDLPGDVLAAPESALCGWIGVILSSLFSGQDHA